MTTDDFVEAIRDQFRMARTLADSDEQEKALAMIEALASARVATAGREYELAPNRQGFEDASCVHLVRMIEEEIADAAAWMVALRLRIHSMQGLAPPSLRHELVDLARLREGLAFWYTAGAIADEDARR